MKHGRLERIRKMKKLNKFDFLAINKRMNENWNGGDSQFCGPTKKITISTGNLLRTSKLTRIGGSGGSKTNYA